MQTNDNNVMRNTYYYITYKTKQKKYLVVLELNNTHHTDIHINICTIYKVSHTLNVNFEKK